MDPHRDDTHGLIFPDMSIPSHCARLGIPTPQSLSALAELIERGAIPFPFLRGLPSHVRPPDAASSSDISIDRIVLVRKTKMGLEFLARFPNSPICRWFLEEELSKYGNFSDCLARFDNDPQEFESFSPSTALFIIAAHRDSTSLIEYLFQVATRTGPEFYWAETLLPIEQTMASLYEHTRATIHCGPTPSPADLPPFSSPDLADWQQRGVNWMIDVLRNRLRGCILGDDAGMGKSAQFLHFVLHLRRHAGWEGPVLIIARDRAEAGRWYLELQRTGSFAVLHYEGSPGICALLRSCAIPSEDSVRFQVLLTVYDIFARDAHFLNKIPFQILCCDNPSGDPNAVSEQLRCLPVSFTLFMIDGVLDSDIHSLTPFVSFLHPNVASDWAVSGAPLDQFLLCRRAAHLDPDPTPRGHYPAHFS
jgi:hypothetical protein